MTLTIDVDVYPETESIRKTIAEEINIALSVALDTNTNPRLPTGKEITYQLNYSK